MNDWNALRAHYACNTPLILAEAKNEWAVDAYMSIGDIVLGAFASPDEELSNSELCRRTGYDLAQVCTHTARLRVRGLLERVDPTHRPVKHRLTGAARTRADLLALRPLTDSEYADGSILGNALRTQPTSAFDLGRTA